MENKFVNNICDMDKVDLRILKTLLNEGEVNLSRIILKSFPRESHNVFKNRLFRLRDKKIINIDHTKTAGVGFVWSIKLNDYFKKRFYNDGEEGR